MKWYAALGVVIAYLLIPYVASAAVIVAPTSSYDGHFSIQHTGGYALYEPSDGASASSTFCVASSTPLTDDCDVSGSFDWGLWAVVDFDDPTSTFLSSYTFQAPTSTAVALSGTIIKDFIDLINHGGLTLAFIAGGILFVILAVFLITGGFSRGTRRGLR